MLAPLGPFNDITSQIIAAAIEVHRVLGPGLLESVYVECLVFELRHRGLDVQREVRVPVVYKGIRMPCTLVLDLLVNAVVVEVKALEQVLPVHQAQLQTQLKVAGMAVGLLLNFNVPVLKDGITRRLNRDALPPSVSSSHPR